MRFIFGRGWVHFADETNGEGDGNGDAGGAAGAGDGDGTASGDGEVLDPAGEETKTDDGAAGDKPGAEGKPKDMLEAITQGLEKTAPKVEKTEAEKAAEVAAAAVAGAKHANGAPKKDAKGNELDDQGKIVKPAEPPKAKTSAELALTPQQLAALKPESRARFSEVITTLKAREGELASLNEKMKPLAEARDSMIGVLQETRTSADQLSAYLEFNRLLSSDKPADLESALKMIEDQRAALYTALGREPDDGGIDLLAEFPDLKQKVADAQITREDALELAAGRRDKAANQQKQQQQQTQQQSAEQVKKAQDKAQSDIETWCTGLAKTDIDYKGKEDKLLEQIDEVIKTYPANQWLSTLKLLYQGIVIQKAPAAKGQQPIRPTGAKPGSKVAANMFEAMWNKPAP